MIPALLLTTPDCIITAGTDGTDTGYCDGTGTPMPGTTFGSISFTPVFFSDAGRTLHAVYTDGAYLHVGVDANFGDLITATVVIGGETYTNADYVNNTQGTNGTVYRWTQKSALVNGNTYIFSVT